MYTIPWDPMANAPSTTMVLRDADHAWIPVEPLNADYQAYLAWVALGNEAPFASDPAVPTPSKP